MKKSLINCTDLGKHFYLSPEYWYSKKTATESLQGTELIEIASLVKKGSKPDLQRSLVLDTSCADKGLLHIAPFLFATSKTSKSYKKRVEEGVVLVSRLRSYLMQVTYIPHGIKQRLDVDTLYCSTEFYILKPKVKGDDIAFLVPWLLSESVQKIFTDATVGGHHPRFGDDLLMSLRIPTYYIDNKQQLNDKVVTCINTSLDSQMTMRNLVN
ncbi:hypothetical protein [Vibrio sp. MA40-2]|uniref:hypothetical protein n=1 Tax=Vibrio sp. MA40-2 TaxID=3391828 RepID=UPI0039A42D71